MPARSQSLIRRDINRLSETIQRHGDTHPPLTAIAPMVHEAAEKINSAWQKYQQAAVAGSKEREDRDSRVKDLLNWIQRWRPALLMIIPGADANIHRLPPNGATPDDVIRVAEDMQALIQEKGDGLQPALEDLGDAITLAKTETTEATAALPAEAEARKIFSDTCLDANGILVRGSEIIRAIFGRTSPEYRQFIARSSKEEEATIETEAMTGET